MTSTVDLPTSTRYEVPATPELAADLIITNSAAAEETGGDGERVRFKEEMSEEVMHLRNSFFVETKGLESLIVGQLVTWIKVEMAVETLDEAVVLTALEAVRHASGNDVSLEADVNFQEALAVFRYLTSPHGQVGSLHPLPTTRIGQKRVWCDCQRCITRLRRRCRHKSNEGGIYGQQMKPTTRLLLIIVLLTFFIALAVAGVAIGISWNSMMSKERDALQRDIDMVLNAVEAFSVRSAEKQAFANELTTAVILAEAVKGGFSTSMTVAATIESQVAQVAGGILDTVFISASNGRNAMVASGFAFMATEMCRVHPNFSVVEILDGVNANHLPAGQEVLLGQRLPNGTYRYLTSPKKCNASSPCTPVAGSEAVLAACINGSYTGQLTVDYAGISVFAAAYPVNCSSLGTNLCAIFTFDVVTRRNQFIVEASAALNVLNPNINASELILYPQNYSAGQLTSRKNGETACVGLSCSIDSTAVTSMNYAAGGAYNSTTVGTSYTGNNQVVASSWLLPNLQVYTVVEVDMNALLDIIYYSLGTSGSNINKVLNGTQEVMLGQRVVVNGTVGFKFIIPPRFISQCYPHCISSPTMTYAAVNCMTGVSKLLDYRGVYVLAAYICVPDLGVGFVLKMDMSEVLDNSRGLLVDYVNLQNARDTTTLELMVGQASTQYAGYLSILSDLTSGVSLPCESGCLVPMGEAPSMMQAIMGKDGISDQEPDYADRRVMSAFTNCSDLSVGIVLKQNLSEIEWPLIVNLLIILGTALVISIIGALLEYLAARRMLQSIEDTWERGKQQVEREKASFEMLVAAMYPKFVSERLLAGDHQIVLEIPELTCFFSDICNFTALSNQLTAAELIEWIGYTFRVMDTTADFHRIFKVKTIGDAYFAIAGLPQLSGENDLDHPAFRMLCFALHVMQLFSGRYTHPEAATAMMQAATKSALARTESKKKSFARKAAAMTADRGSDGSSNTTSQGGKNSQCSMRYGIAMGPVTVGVLQGKCPAFDVWGRTVNLSSRLESASRPGNVLVGELAYNSVVNLPACLVHWERPITAYAKGIGNVQGYFVRSTDLLPPKALLTGLGVEPALGTYRVDAGAELIRSVRVGGGNSGSATKDKDHSKAYVMTETPVTGSGVSDDDDGDSSSGIPNTVIHGGSPDVLKSVRVGGRPIPKL